MKLASSIVALVLAAGALGGCAVLLDARASSREAAAEARTPPVGRLIDVGRARIHVHVEGSGPDLVLIHGANGNLRDFTFALSARLAERYRVIALDRPGLGWSDVIDGHEDPRAQARALRAAAEVLEVRNPIVLGHSYGGAVALAWGLGAPDDTAGLVIVAGASHPWEGGLGLSQTLPATALGRWAVVPAVTAFASDGQVEGVLEGIFAPQAVPDGYGAHIGTGLSLRRAQIVRNSEQVSTLKPYLREMAPGYGGLEMPIEIVHSDADTTVGLEIHGRRLAEDAPDARLTVLEGVGHMPQHSDPDAIIAAIDRAATRAGLR
ncbi:alpha/beta fold hydrolase [Rhodobaculum claviforme]|nr:alpha/beta hydrolase [Rhodobaculum claviforme]